MATSGIVTKIAQSRNVWLIAPYALWMLLMAALPPTPQSYAIRTAAVAALLAFAIWRLMAVEAVRFRLCMADVATGVLAGLLVFAVWILPEQFDWAFYRRYCIVGDGGAQTATDAGFVLLSVRLLGSAFVISVVEDFFFRRWLHGFAGFGWMVALFAVEHDRWLVGALAGVVYGLLAIRRGLGSAIVAHVVTNLVLGVWVLLSGQLRFW